MKLRLLMGGVTAAGSLLAAHPQAAPPQAATTTPVATSATTATTCDAGAWRADDVSVQGRPDGFDAGDRGATYVWHDDGGWHLRTTDMTNTAHVYSGRIVLSTGAFRDVQGVALEPGDHYYVDGRTLYYRFVTYNRIDGLDFRVGDCSPAPGQAVTFHLRYDGTLDLNRVIVGDRNRHPDSDPFRAVRSL